MAESLSFGPLPEGRRGDGVRLAQLRGGKIIDAEIIGSAITGASIATSTITEEDWSAPSLQNSWVDYGAPHQTARYRKDPNGVVHIQGMIKSGTTTAGTLLFTLPAGYRPDAELWYTNYAAGGALALMSIAASGAVTIGAGFSATNTQISCSFAT